MAMNIKIERGREYVQVTVLGQRITNLFACPDCGSVVLDTHAHNAFHAALDRIARTANAAFDAAARETL